jgi:uncharacterized protein (DUF1499 family)
MSRHKAPGLKDGALAPLSGKPNAVSSEAGTDAKFKVKPLSATQPELIAAITSTGGKIVAETAEYVAATYTSKLMRFVDDVEFRRDGDQWQVRSASRVGYSDMGVNRKRVNALRAALA